MNEKPCDTCQNAEVRCRSDCEAWRKWARLEWRRVKEQLLDALDKMEDKK